MKMINELRSKSAYLLQELAVAHLFLTFFFGPLLTLLFVIYIVFYTSFYPLLFPYMLWVYIDRKTCMRDGRRIHWIRNMGLWKHFNNYFPQKLVKMADLPPTSNYILCTFPHGIMCSAAFAQYGNDHSDFAKAFPGITLTCHTLTCNFYFPLTREYILSLGMCSVSKEALLYQLNKPSGHAINLVVGGSAEAMKSTPGVYRVVLKNRKGFAKLALNTGTPLVPVFIFGEVDIYDQKIFPEESRMYKFQQAVRKWTGIAPILFRGRGFLGIFPYRVPVTTVVGKPIPVDKVENPSREDVDKLHKVFVEQLVELFEEHKNKYVSNPESTFLSIED